MSDIKLLPCPFCGSSNLTIIIDRAVRYYPHIACRNCIMMVEHSNLETLKEKWNTRHTQDTKAECPECKHSINGKPKDYEIPCFDCCPKCHSYFEPKNSSTGAQTDKAKENN